MSRSNRKQTTTKTLSLAAALAASVLLAAGCMVTVDDEILDGTVHIGVDVRPALADLEVTWSIDHSDATSLCSIYGVDRFSVSLYGHESRDSVIDCRASWWSTENDFLALTPGQYRVTITALDRFDLVVSSVSTDVSVRGGSNERINVNFSSASF